MSSNSDTMTPRTAVIAGCGFVGRAVAQLLHADGWSVLGLTYAPASLPQFAEDGYRVVACDIADRAALAAIVSTDRIDLVVHCASSRRGGVDEYRRVYLEGARVLTELLRPHHFIFTSSTSVYPQVNGEWVNEESEAEPVRETARILRETEELVLAANGAVARLAGIYGPGRSVLLQKFFRGEAVIEGDGRRWINQVHRDDIASALRCIAHAGKRGIFNVTDDQPLMQRDVYARLSAMCDRPLPPIGPIDLNRKRAWTSKRVSNAKLRTLGWAPRYPSFFDAIENDPGLLQPLAS
jgi:nucleoside-diphosphate-sugar epimerase